MGLLGEDEIVTQASHRGLLAGLLGRQFLTTFHHLQQGILQTPLSAFQRVQLVLQFLELFGIDRPGVQQAAIAVFTLAHGVNLGLQPGNFGVKVRYQDAESGQSVGSAAFAGSHLVEMLLLGEVRGPVRQSRQLGIEFGQLQERYLLCYFSFHCYLRRSQCSTDQCAVGTPLPEVRNRNVRASLQRPGRTTGIHWPNGRRQRARRH